MFYLHSFCFRESMIYLGTGMLVFFFFVAVFFSLTAVYPKGSISQCRTFFEEGRGIGGGGGIGRGGGLRGAGGGSCYFSR